MSYAFLPIHELRYHGAVSPPRDADTRICYSHKSVYGLVILGSSLRPDRERVELLESTVTQHPVCDRTAYVLVTEQAEVMSRVCTHSFFLFFFQTHQTIGMSSPCLNAYTHTAMETLEILGDFKMTTIFPEK